jgi:hypothetical protein
MVFDGWPDLLRILVGGGAAYAGLIVLEQFPVGSKPSSWKQTARSAP